MNKFGGIYVADGTVVNSLSSDPTKLRGFDTDTIFAGIDPNAFDSSLRVKVPGPYSLSGNVVLTSTDSIFDVIKVEVYKNDLPTGFISGGNLAGSLNASSVSSLIALGTYTQLNTRNLDQNIHGALQILATGQPLSSGVDIDVTKGTGKLLIIINAGTDVAGTLTVTGDTVDRNTGAVIVGNTNDIIVDALSVDDSDTDAEGNARYALSGGYITSNWFRGDVTLSTTDLNLSDVDVYHCSFEQFNDTGTVTLETFDINCLCSNTAGWLYAYLYSVNVVGSKVSVVRESSLDIPVGVSEADNYYRLREGNLDVDLAAATDGIFVEINEGPDATQYWKDITTKVWARRNSTLSTEGSLFSTAIPLQALLYLNKGDVITLQAYTTQGNTLNATLNSGNVLLFSK